MSKATPSLDNAPARESFYDEVTVDRNFDVHDKQGRQVGARVFTCTMDVTLDPSMEGRGSFLPGTYYRARVQQIRDGEKYGAAQSAVYFTTERERDEYVWRRLQDSAKRAAKNHQPNQRNGATVRTVLPLPVEITTTCTVMGSDRVAIWSARATLYGGWTLAEVTERDRCRSESDAVALAKKRVNDDAREAGR